MEWISERLYELNPGGYCGVFMPEDVMRKLLKLQSKYQDEVKRVLLDNAERLYPMHWSLAYPNGKQEIFKFVIRNEGVTEVKHIINLFKANKPEHIQRVYIVDSYDDKKNVAKFIEDESLYDPPKEKTDEC